MLSLNIFIVIQTGSAFSLNKSLLNLFEREKDFLFGLGERGKKKGGGGTIP